MRNSKSIHQSFAIRDGSLTRYACVNPYPILTNFQAIQWRFAFLPEMPMRSMAAGVLAFVAIVFSFAAKGEAAKTPALIYYPWTKVCSSDACYIGMHAITEMECSNAVAVSFSERPGEARRALRIILPAPGWSASG